MENATAIEIFWSFVVLVGAIVTWISVLLVKGDRSAYQHSGEFEEDSSMDRLSFSRIRNKLVDALILTGFLAIGVIAMLNPPPQNQDPVTWRAIFSGAIFVLSAIGLTSDSILYLIDRRYRLQRTLPPPHTLPATPRNPWDRVIEHMEDQKHG